MLLVLPGGLYVAACLYRRGWFRGGAGVAAGGGSSRLFFVVERFVRRGGFVLALVLVVSLLPFVPARAAPAGPVPSPVVPVKERSVDVSAVPARQGSVSQSDTAGWSPARVVWPAAAAATVQVGAAAAATSVGGLPVRVVPGLPAGDVLSRRWLADEADRAESPARVRVEVLDRGRAAGVGAALLLRVSRADGMAGRGSARLEVDYSGFKGAFGAGWALRLRLVALPACALAPVRDAMCAAGRPLGSRSNNPTTGVVSGDLPVPGAADADAGVVALVAGADSENGTFARTSLSQAYSWQAGTSGGGFSWSYPLAVPPSPGGLEPEVAFSYSSAAVDSRTNAEAGQPSWLGEGWDYNPGYIERQYRPCADDLEGLPAHYPNATGDPCWREPNATLVLGGRSSEIVQDDATGAWRLIDDDGSRIDLLTGGHDYTSGGEYWRLVTTDGTQYYFGRYRLPGWNAGDRVTNSVARHMMFANHTWEPCFVASNFASSHCFKPWRWQLDHVVDADGNSMSLWYTTERNRAGMGGSVTTVADNDRGGVLDRIEYGTRVGGEADTTTPPMRVVFTTADRCLAATCWSGSPARPVAANWPDTPWDLQCWAAPCTNNPAPTYWSHRRLSKVSTQVYSGGSYQDVDEWGLTHTFPGHADGSDPSLWLSDIVHTGKAGSAADVALPAVHFDGVQYANRTDFNEAAVVPKAWKYRVTSVKNGTGGEVQVAYEGSDCTVSAQADPDQNSKRCFPQYHQPEGSPAGWAWWNKYRVTQVVERDLVGGSPDVVHSYAYSTAGSDSTVLWHHNDAAVWSMSLPRRSWSDFRGWPTVTVTKGATGGTQSQSKYLYFRGLDGDRTDAGVNTRRVTITTSDGTVSADADWRAGILRERIDYASPGGQALHKTVNDPWASTTASRSEDPVHAQPPVWTAEFVDIGASIGYTWVAATNTWRQTRQQNTFEATSGQLTAVSDLGDTSTGSDDTCTRYEYVHNLGTAWILDAVSRVETVAKPCTTAATYPADLLSDTRIAYDGKAYDTGWPDFGHPTRSRVVSAHDGTNPTFVDTSTMTYDSYGRVLTAADALNRTTTTAYTPATGGPVTAVAVTNPAGHSATVNADVRGQPTSTVDANAKTTTAQYDPLGRLTKVWLPGRPTTQTANSEYAYTVSAAAASHVQTKTLGPDGNQIAAFDIYDGLLRPRQTQSSAPDGKRAIADTRYDSRGLAIKASTFYNAASAPTATLVGFADTDVATQRRLTYDGLGRPATDELWSLNTFKWQTGYSYDGDRVNTNPSQGGIPTTTITDAKGRTVALRQYHGGEPTGEADQTSYGYDRLDRLTTVTDEAGNDWTNSYDLRGLLTSKTDPDAGTSTYTYDNAGQLVGSTDARGEKLHRVYDTLGRQTQLRDDTATGALRASWTYDTLAKGQLTSATRHTGGAAYTTTITGYTDLYAPTGATLAIPAAEGGLAGTYTTTATYKPNGAPATAGLPATGGLPAETLTHSYTPTGLPNGVASASATYLASTSYHWDGAVNQRIIGVAAHARIRITNTLDEPTRRLKTVQVDTENATTANTWDDRSTTEYNYDNAGNITVIAGKTNGVRDQVECFRYDYLQRLTEAWTEASWSCQTPQRAGADPYRLSWTYDTAGNRRTQTDHDPGGTITTNYTYPAPGGTRPHALTAATRTAPSGTTNAAYGYDPAGNTTTRSTTGTNQTLTWDPEGKLTQVTQAGATTAYLYDADGNRLIRREPTATTLYLPGGTELHLPTGASQPTGTRYYTHNGATVATRTPTGMTRLVSDHHGTGELAFSATMTRRRSLPFGEPRGPQPTNWVGDKGFVGGTQDTSTGLTHLGAREYDPTTGRFISVDPLMDLADPQQWNGYAYANNNPTTQSDPSGLRACSDDACGAGADFEDMYGQYHQITGHNDGCHGCSGTKDANKNKGKKKPGGGKQTSTHNGNVQTTYENGTTVINGIVVPEGGPNPDELFRYVDQKIAEQMHPLGPSREEATLAAIFRACFKPFDCSSEFQFDIWWMYMVEISGGVAEAAVTLGASMGGAGAGIRIPKRPAKACSFSGTTKVLMADGTTKPIEDIQVGDQVTATDPETGEHGPHKVTHVWVHDDRLVDLLLANGAAVATTEDHPFWNATDQQWQRVDTVGAGEKLLSPNGHRTAVAAVRLGPTPHAPAYNLTIANLHTYYVLAGDTPVLVHNCGDWLPDTRGKLPGSWGSGTPNKKGVGTRWTDPDNPGNGVRVDRGDPNSSFPGQQVDHVIVRRNGNVIGRDGRPISGSIQDNAEMAHIPLGEWQTWESWYKP
jgi:RHS repeat-associated protein